MPFEHGVKLARKHRRLGVGVHLTLFGARPVAHRISGDGRTKCKQVFVCIVGILLYIKFVKPGRRIMCDESATKRKSFDISPMEPDYVGDGGGITESGKQPEQGKEHQ